MKKTRQELEQYLTKHCNKISLKQDKINEIVNVLMEEHQIPASITTDMISRGKLAGQDISVLFCLLKAIGVQNKTREIIDEFFMPVEIQTYSNTKFEKQKIKFPIIIPCIQVAEDQWIGATDTKFFMDLRRAQMISYNENAQRVLTRVTKANGEESYKITIVEETVTGICERLDRKEYIPTPITLNIPQEDDDAKFFYDEEQKSLVIRSLSAFDISDGYHRYVAMGRKYDENKDFNYPWELRIINFPETKARHFVFQEDQKTKMTKLNSDSMDSYNAGNIVVTRLNDDMNFDFYHQINNTNGKINFAQFAQIVNWFYFQANKKVDNAEIRRVQNELKTKFNTLFGQNDEYLNKKIEYKKLVVIMYVLCNVPEEELWDNIINKMVEKIGNIDNRKLQVSKGITKPLINDLEVLLEEVR